VRALIALTSLLCASTAWGASPPADVERLAAGLPGGFRRTKVAIYPPLDQSRLSQAAASDGSPSHQAWAAFVETMGGYQNLSLARPTDTRRALRRAPGYAKALRLAHELRGLGEDEYRAVRLQSAAKRMRAALNAYLDLGHDVVDPEGVARTALALGLAQLEARDRTGARASFRQALQIEPSLRLRPGFDRRESVEAFEEARASLVSEGPPVPDSFTLKRRRLAAVDKRHWVVHARLLADRVELALHSPRGVSLHTAPVGGDPRAAGEQLAARVWACLPFGSPPRRAVRRAQLRLDAGFTDFVYLDSPVDAFNNVGVGVHLSWLVASTISLDAHFSLTNSGRDREEDLRDDVATVRGWAGPGFAIEGDRWGASAHLGVEVGTTTAFETTTNPACKFFEPDDGIPDALCDFDRDVEAVPRAVTVGAVLALGVRLRLVDDIYLALRAWAATQAFETQETGLGLPVGGHVGLGYRLF
jgi:hypothetical protein